MIDSESIPSVTVEQMREVDFLAENQFHLALLQMMENAGRNLAHLSRERFLGGTAAARRITVLAGPGGNGGGGMAASRRLHNWGARVTVILGSQPDRLAEVPRHQLNGLQAIGVPVMEATERLPASDLILDAFLGYSAKGAPRQPMAKVIEAANGSGIPILALDLPTGLDPETGAANEPAVRAAATMTLALPKVGLTAPGAESFVGELWLADISIPHELYETMGLDPPQIFSRDDLVRL